MVKINIELPETVLSAMHTDPQEFAREMRVAAAVKWYELGRISQEKASEIAGLSRTGFIKALSKSKVSPFQYSPEELKKELNSAH